MFVPEAAGNSQAGWCESPIGDIGLICVPGTAVEGWQAAIDLVQRFRAVHLDQGSVAWGPIPVWRGGWRGGPGPGGVTRRVLLGFTGIEACYGHDLRREVGEKSVWLVTAVPLRRLGKDANIPETAGELAGDLGHPSRVSLLFLKAIRHSP